MIYIACRRFFIGEDRFSTILSRSKVSSLIVEFSSNPQGVRYFDPAREDEKRRMIFHYHWLSLLSDNCRHAGCPPLMQPPAPVTALVASRPQFGVGSAPMSACLDVFAATPGVPVTAPWIAGNWRVTCAVYWFLHHRAHEGGRGETVDLRPAAAGFVTTRRRKAKLPAGVNRRTSGGPLAT